MWEMLDPDFECGNDCWGPGPPPEFLIPPPPRPPSLHDIAKCSEEPLPDIEMCDAIPLLDASYHISPSLQTSTVIMLCSVVIVIVVLLSSLLVWKHKRKVQNFLPCKTPTRTGHHLDAIGSVSGGAQSVTYEDPDVHVGRRPLVMRHHHNMELLQHKSIHFPSGYPMTRSPPLFVCSSPGPDPYRSHDNVYEELGPARDSDVESEPASHSEDDFAEDELSLPGERSFHKATATATGSNGPTVCTIYHERTSGTAAMAAAAAVATTTTLQNVAAIPLGVYSSAIVAERNCLLTVSTTAAAAAAAAAAASAANACSGGGPSRIASPEGNMWSRKFGRNTKPATYSVDALHSAASSHQESDVLAAIHHDHRPIVTLPFKNSHNNNNAKHSMTTATANNHHTSGRVSSTEVERRNRINSEMSLTNSPVATIFRDRPPFGVRRTTPHHSYNISRSRTNPRSLDRRRIQPTSLTAVMPDQSYHGYAEPAFHEDMLYDACLRTPDYPYILPEFTSFRTDGGVHIGGPAPINAHQIYSRDSSFGSDSGYSHHTHNSARGGWTATALSSSHVAGVTTMRTPKDANTSSSGSSNINNNHNHSNNNNNSRMYEASS